jgi:hypothetical protein
VGIIDPERRKRVVIVTGSLAVTALFAWLAFMLGTWGFEARNYVQHQQRLRNLVAKKPRLEQVVQALTEEGSPPVASPASEAELARLAREKGGARAAEILEKGRRWPQTRVFRAGSMLYFLFFDADGVLRDYALGTA